MKNYQALIVDDELGNRELLTALIAAHCPQIGRVATADSMEEALKVLNQQVIDVVFLDIEMPGGTGFDLLNQLPEIKFKVIFVTAYDAYALKAIKYSALDYLLKPVDPLELKTAVEKLEASTVQREQLDLLSYNLNQPQDRRIALATQEEVIFAQVSEIIRLQAEANYTRVYLKGDEAVLLSGNLGHFEKLLQDQQFYRPHQSHLINMRHISKYVKSEGGYFQMSDGAQIPIARLKKEEVKRLFLS
ncbi:MAG: LytTR family DNA-binding domain-containing protein [Cytophagales bacterium]|nr:LytTR family DNA-binding domain-containing protein [Cytophagales bacterium]